MTALQQQWAQERGLDPSVLADEQETIFEVSVSLNPTGSFMRVTCDEGSLLLTRAEAETLLEQMRKALTRMTTL